MIKTLEEFFRDLGISESSGRYNIKNNLGYIGKYQMGESALIDAGYYKKPSGRYNNDWSGQFTGKDGVYSVNDFLNNHTAQENANLEYKRRQWNLLKSTGADKYIGQTVGGVPITASGLLGASHLGHAYVSKYLESGGKDDFTDKYGTSVSKYLKKFQNYDVAPLTNSEFTFINTNNNFDQASINYGGLHQIPSKYETDHERTLKNIQNIMNPLGQPTGFAADVDYNQLANRLGLQILNMNVPSQIQQSGIAGYTNPLTGDNRIFTREEVGAMSGDEFARHEKEIMAQTRALRGQMPTNIDMEREISAGGAVYVRPYTRSDGTQVKGYYRSR